MKYLVIKSNNQGEWFYKQFCLVKLDNETIKFLQSVMSELSKVVVPPLLRNWSCSLYYQVAFEFYADSNDYEPIDSFLEFATSEWAIIDIMEEDVLDFDLGEVQRTDGNRLVLDADGSGCFKCYNKYGDGEEIYSYSFSLKDVLDNYTI